MKKFSIIILLFGVTLLLAGEVSAQLITDSNKRLKTQKAKEKPNTGGSPAPSRSPFAAFRKKQGIERRSVNGLGHFFNDKSFVSPRSVSGRRDTKTFFPERRVSPRSSQGSPFRNQNYAFVTPRSISGQAFKGYNNYRSPRYSVGNPFKGYNAYRSPKYSVGNVWSAKDRAKYPRYSTGNPFKGYNFYRSPKYSVGNVWSTKNLNKSPRYSVRQVWSSKDLYKSPRYSVGNVWSTNDLNKSPRYSVGNIWSTKDLNKSPRYSIGQVWSSKVLNKSPRYSVGNIWTKDDLNKSPRYSIGNPYAGYKFLNIPPRYSSNKDRFVVDKRAKKENADFEFRAGSFVGDYKYTWKKTKYMHPSSKHRNDKVSTELARDGLRKWNIFWAKVDGNEEEPKGVKKKVSKPKFDRKEAEIWNN
ncbi:MAG: hypothetical protein JXR03_09365 [Cyclobacteriaceae bacterium]